MVNNIRETLLEQIKLCGDVDDSLGKLDVASEIKSFIKHNSTGKLNVLNSYCSDL